jgi:serine/threonine protein kinase
MNAAQLKPRPRPPVGIDAATENGSTHALTTAASPEAENQPKPPWLGLVSAVQQRQIWNSRFEPDQQTCAQPLFDSRDTMERTSWEKAKDVLFEALRLPTPEREGFVRGKLRDEPDVCAEVLTLLRNADTSDLALSTPLFRLDEVDELDELQPATQLGQYTIIDRLGRGGMGQVFLARDQKLQRRVALKCLLSRSSAEADRDRILIEAQAAAGISHTNVAAVHDVIEHEQRAFMVMEYVDGENLGACLRRERLTLDRVVSIGIELARALGAAHAVGVVHGDLKPANVQITPDGSAKVLDFGVARTVRAAATVPATMLGGAAPVSVLTVVGGTPQYMSPEQLRRERIDERSDIYSLGIVLFEMATGRRPDRATTTMTSIHFATETVPRAESIDPKLPKALADVIARALEPSVIARYQSALDLEHALEMVQDQLRAKPLSTRELIKKWLTRIAVGVPLTLLALELVGFVTMYGFNWTFGRTGPYDRFGVESWREQLTWGIRAVVPSLIVATFAFVIVAAARFVLNVLQLIGPVRHLCQTIRSHCVDSGVRMGLNRPTGLAQALAGIALAALFIFTQVNRDVILAWTANFNTDSVARLLPIGENEGARTYYFQLLDVAIPVFVYGFYRAIRLRRAQKVRDGIAMLAILAGIIAIAVLMREWPYRTLNHRDFERADLAGARCYVSGESGDELLLLCPGGEPPRNHVVKRDDPQLRRIGKVENVFRGIKTAAADP